MGKPKETNGNRHTGIGCFMLNSGKGTRCFWTADQPPKTSIIVTDFEEVLGKFATHRIWVELSLDMTRHLSWQSGNQWLVGAGRSPSEQCSKKFTSVDDEFGEVVR